ncbi:hypothetical protein Csa_003254 [Cucumis sativus]|uniref:Uncharacterized protein n=2 Tax=Cucumis sativus TaxID=3659 RepID=A0A0A0KEK5_CUCSA|nr:hypothetical protein Csa_003254 [Cucumis sativus]
MEVSEECRDEEHNVNSKTNKLQYGFICKYVTILFVLAVIMASCALWLAYRPKNPEFSVVEAVIYNLTVSPPSQLLTTMACTIVTRNPNKLSSIYYDQLTGVVLYKDQQITPQVMLSPVINEKKTTVEIPLKISGAAVSAVSVTEELANEIVRSTESGLFWLRVVLMGRVKWKLGGVRIGYYALSVKCDVLVTNTKDDSVGSLPSPRSTTCNVDFA